MCFKHTIWVLTVQAGQQSLTLNRYPILLFQLFKKLFFRIIFILKVGWSNKFWRIHTHTHICVLGLYSPIGSPEATHTQMEVTSRRPGRIRPPASISARLYFPTKCENQHWMDGRCKVHLTLLPYDPVLWLVIKYYRIWWRWILPNSIISLFHFMWRTPVWPHRLNLYIPEFTGEPNKL